MENYGLRAIVLCLVFGPLLFTVGGLITNLGWSKKRSYDQRENVIKAVVLELKDNSILVQRAREVIKNWAASNGETLFPGLPFQTTQLNSALTSGVFSFEGAANKKAKEVMEAYRSAVADFNLLLGRVGRNNPGVYLKVEFIG